MSVVVDASMTIAWLFRDERTETPQLVLRRVAREGGLVPSLWRLEVANVLRNAVRRRRCDQGYAVRCLQRLGRLRIMIDSETDAHAWGATRQLSIEHDLTLYDAAYLELAIRRGQPLATADAALIARKEYRPRNPVRLRGPGQRVNGRAVTRSPHRRGRGSMAAR